MAAMIEWDTHLHTRGPKHTTNNNKQDNNSAMAAMIEWDIFP